jgi:hypothetical protein
MFAREKEHETNEQKLDGNLLSENLLFVGNHMGTYLYLIIKDVRVPWLVLPLVRFLRQKSLTW